MAVLLKGRPLAFLAFQASAFIDGSPTEMAVLREPGGEALSVRIRPHPSWAGLDWDADVEAASGLSRPDLDATGVEAGEVCRRLAEWTQGHLVVVQHEAVALPLIYLLHKAAGLAPPSGATGFYETLDELAACHPYDYWEHRGEFILPYSGLRPHRAAYDAALMAEAASCVAAGRPQTRRAM